MASLFCILAYEPLIISKLMAEMFCNLTQLWFDDISVHAANCSVQDTFWNDKAQRVWASALVQGCNPLGSERTLGLHENGTSQVIPNQRAEGQPGILSDIGDLTLLTLAEEFLQKLLHRSVGVNCVDD